MTGLDAEGCRLICLKGNHEDIMWQQNPRSETEVCASTC
jgi:hypothetical protein